MYQLTIIRFSVTHSIANELRLNVIPANITDGRVSPVEAGFNITLEYLVKTFNCV